MHRVRLAWLRLAAVGSDALCLAAAWVAAVQVRSAFHRWWPLDLVPGEPLLAPVHAGRALPIGLLLVPVWLAALHRVGSYDALRRKSLARAGSEVASAAALALVVVLAALFLLRVEPASRTLLVGYAALTVPVVLASRALQAALLRSMRRRAYDPHRVLVVGEPTPWLDIVGRHAAWGVEPVVVAADEVRDRLLAGGVDEVYLSGAVDRRLLDDTAALCDELGVPLSIDASFLGVRARADVVDYDGFSVLTFSRAPGRPVELVLKRLLDLGVGGLALVLTAPVLAVAAAAIRLHDGGPVLFVQERVGRYGRPFRMYKLRTMVVDAESRRSALPNDADGPVFKLRRDPRVTPIGRLLRRLSVDELPQLVNVLRGEMSLVGPRPPLASEVARYERWQLRRLSVRPGLTCTWQVSGRSDLPFDRWMALDLAYIDDWSLWLDLRLLARTVPAVLRGTGAR